MTEIKLFNEWLPTCNLTPASITLWYGLMYIFNRSAWKTELPIPISAIEAQTKISRSSIYRERERLCKAGLITYVVRQGRYSGVYSLMPLSSRFASHNGTQNSNEMFHIGTQTQATVSHRGTQKPEKAFPQNSFVSRNTSHTGTQTDDDTSFIINNKLNNKENIKRNDVADESAPLSIIPQKKKEKSSGQKERKRGVLFDSERWLATLDTPWQELMRQWLDYKSARRQTYKTEIGAVKCLAQLQNLSGNNVRAAQAIIDRSMANNWSGIFALQPSNGSRGQPDFNTPQHGQRIGQIMQTEDEAKRQRMIERLHNAGHKPKN